MTVAKSILSNFKVYDTFLASIPLVKRKPLIALKMMYAIHMQTKQVDGNRYYIMLQLLRFILKISTLPFHIYVVNLSNKGTSCAVMANTQIEKDLTKKEHISLLTLKKEISFNPKFIDVYRDVFSSLLLLRDPTLNKYHVLALIHRLIDYTQVLHTIDCSNINVLFVENDRLPQNLAIIHKLQSLQKTTVKYDNWLIDAVNHNDVYCDYYYYPNDYHKSIVQSFASNRDLHYSKGGFLNWDNLKNYPQNTTTNSTTIIYFTQFGINIEEHAQYINDIRTLMSLQNKKFHIIIKVHPREDRTTYQEYFQEDEVIGKCQDIYSYIHKATFCFSIFSTISLEAKHIIKNSYFINYHHTDFTLVSYDKLGLDLVTNRGQLAQVIEGAFKTIDQNQFIKKINSNYPHSCHSLKEAFCHD